MKKNPVPGDRVEVSVTHWLVPSCAGVVEGIDLKTPDGDLKRCKFRVLLDVPYVNRSRLLWFSEHDLRVINGQE